MQLRIQPDESLRSYVERNLFLHSKSPTLDVFRVPELKYCFWGNRQVKTIANIFGWHGSYGFNKLVHLHTDFPIRGVLRSNKRLSYSESEFLLESYYFGVFRLSAASVPKHTLPHCAFWTTWALIGLG